MSIFFWKKLCLACLMNLINLVVSTLSASIAGRVYGGESGSPLNTALSAQCSPGTSLSSAAAVQQLWCTLTKGRVALPRLLPCCV